MRGRLLRNIIAKLLLQFGGLQIGLPAASVGVKGNPGVGVFQGDIITRDAIAVELEAIGDPAIGVIAFDLHEQVDGQVGGLYVMGYGEQVAIGAIEGIENGAIQFKGELRVVLARVGGQQFGLFEVFAEGGVDATVVIVRVVVRGRGEAGTNGEGQQQRGREGD